MITYKLPHITPSITVCNSTAKGRYNGHELSQPAVRAGADNSLALPSRIGNTLTYRSGQTSRVNAVAPAAIKARKVRKPRSNTD